MTIVCGMRYEGAPSEFKGRLRRGKDWRDIVAWVGDLPAMPQVVGRVMQLLEDPNATHDSLTALIGQDVALAARILKIANSAMFGRQREIETLNQAVVVIGLRSLKGIVAAVALRDLCREESELNTMIWEHGICTAMCASMISKRLKQRFLDESFLLGLMHCLGQIVLINKEDTAKDYHKVMYEIEDLPVTYVVAEEEIFGFSHPLIGALVAKKWNFSSETCQTILHYRDPIETKPELEQDQKAAIVQLADLIVHEIGIGSPANYPRSRGEVRRLALLLGFDAKTASKKLEEISHYTAQQFENEKRLFE